MGNPRISASLLILEAKSKLKEYEKRRRGRLCLNCGGVGEHVEISPSCQEAILVDGMFSFEEAVLLLEEYIITLESKIESSHYMTRFGEKVVKGIQVIGKRVRSLVPHK